MNSMKRLKVKHRALSVGMTFGALALSSLPALAQANRSNNMMDEIIAAGGNNTCNEMSWNLRRDNADNIRGVIWYTGGAGVSNAMGKADADGKFTINIISIYGSGPVGTVTGTRNADGSTDAQFVGTSCKTGMIHLKPGQTSSGG
jgi:hypothetical protein